MRYLKRSSFSSNVPWRLLGILFLCDLVIMTYYFTGSAVAAGATHPQPAFYITALISVFGPLLSGILCLPGSFRHLKRSASSPGVRLTRRFSPILWGMSGFIYAFGQAVWLAQILVTQQMPHYPAPSHFIELLTYLCFIAAILLLPERGLSLFARLRILLDSLMIMAVVTTLCYYFVLGPLLVQGNGTSLARAVGGLYPALDLLAMFCVLVVALRSGERELRPVLIMLGLAAVLQFVVNVLHLYDVLYKGYNELSLASVLMIAYGTLLVGAAQTVNKIQQKGAKPAQQDDLMCTDTPWKIVLPSALVLVFGLLVFLLWLYGDQTFPGQIIIVYVGGFVVLVLILLRQFLTMCQLDLLQRRLRKKNRSLDLLNAQLGQQATTDPLTNLPNHRSLVGKLDENLVRARATVAPCSVIFMDIDHFKVTNDCYGHLIGDVALSCFAEVVTATVRAGDVVGRWGGEEFVAILPGAGPEEAFQVAERIRVAVSRRVPADECAPGLTCSLGVATYPQDASERESLIWYADRAMYVAKRLGRNQTRTAHEPLVLARREMVLEAENGEEASMSEIAETLFALVEARDPALSRHARRVAALALKVAQELDLSPAEARVVGLGGLLHDLGHIAMPDQLLFKHDLLDSRELESRARYPALGAEILLPVPRLRAIAALVRAQSECVDGSGYPDGLRSEEIPLGARIVAVADAYDSLLSERPSHRTHAAALKELRRNAGSCFDPYIVEALARVLAASPRLSRIDVA